MKKYGIIQITDNMILHHGVYPYHEAVGHLVCQLTDVTEEWLNDGYIITKQEDFSRLEGDTGFGWFRTFEEKEIHRVAHESWYLLEVYDSKEESNIQ